jgi:uncharacterized membrane protein
VCVGCIAFLVAASPKGNDWPAGIAMVGFLFVFIQLVVVLVVLLFAAIRRTQQTTMSPTWAERQTKIKNGLAALGVLTVLYASGG